MRKYPPGAVVLTPFPLWPLPPLWADPDATPQYAAENSDGEWMRYLLRYTFIESEEFAAWANTYADLVGVLLWDADYPTYPPDKALKHRISWCRHSDQYLLQDRLVTDSAAETLTDDEWAVINLLRKEGEPPDAEIEQPVLSTWTAKVPLVLLTTGYAPYTDVPRPDAPDAVLYDGGAHIGPVHDDTGGIVWLDPSSDHAMLESMHRARLVTLTEVTPPIWTGTAAPAQPGT